MKIDEIRIYAEVLEQGIDFKEYFKNIVISQINIINIYTKKSRREIRSTDSLTDRIRKSKDVDILITFISDEKEYPFLMVEYSTAVPTDDHKMQRSDVYYWSSVYKTPMMKIYPNSKGMNQNFGGGNKFTDELESVLAYSQGALFFPIQWETIKNSNTLRTKKNALSCIYYSPEIEQVLNNLYKIFLKNNNYQDYYSEARNLYYNDNKDVLQKYSIEDVKNLIVNSSRFRWEGNSLISKINRFGHAMDPDRGVLYFTNMLVGVDKCITEIQINRTSVEGKGGYRSLFDSSSRESLLRKMVDDLIENSNNVFTPENALNIFQYALCIEQWNLFTLKPNANDEYYIKDEVLKNFLYKCPSITSKCIFYLSTQLLLTDKNRNIICRVKWNSAVINEYLSSLNSANFNPISIKELSFNDFKEDLVTFASVELYKLLKCTLIAVSYPGAQGDRCVLFGEGRNVLRTYIDIIAVKKDKLKVTLFLEECKDTIIKSKGDVKKLKDFVNSKDQIYGLKNLMKKVSDKNDFDEIKISVGAKHSNNLPYLDVDYIFMFNIENNNKNETLINYSVALVDTSLIKMFDPLSDKFGKLKGKLVFDKFFIIND